MSPTCSSGQSTPVFLRTSSLTRCRCCSSLKSAVIASYFVSYQTSYDTRTEAVTNFRELRLDELRRISLPRTRVNKGVVSSRERTAPLSNDFLRRSTEPSQNQGVEASRQS